MSRWNQKEDEGAFVIEDAELMIIATADSDHLGVIDSGATATILTATLAEKLYDEGMLSEIQIVSKTFSTASGTPLTTTATATLQHPVLATGKVFVAPPESGLRHSLIGSPQLAGRTLCMTSPPSLSGVPLTRAPNGHFLLDIRTTGAAADEDASGSSRGPISVNNSSKGPISASYRSKGPISASESSKGTTSYSIRDRARAIALGQH